MRAHVTSVNDIHAIDEIVDHQTYDMFDVVFDRDRGEVRIPFGPRLNTRRFILIIAHAEEVTMEDSSDITQYPIDGFVYDVPSRSLRVLSDIPSVFEIQVSAIDVRVE